ncbi:MAG TPA: LysE family translocator [Pseudolabrys sp.]|nr:LysE family translocator [Pseudolabrys sp.]
MLGFLLTSLIVELTPGPNMGTLASLTLHVGRRGGLAVVAGIALGLAIVGVLAAFGLAALIADVPLAYQLLRWGGVLYMLYLAYDTWRDASGGDADFESDGSLFLRGLTINLLNPKAAVFYLAILPTFIDPARGSVLVQNLILVVIFVAVATTVHAGIVLLAVRLRPLLVSGAGERRFRRVLAGSMALIALWFAWETR